MLNPKHAWISRIRKGDVLRSRSGLLRVVRRVSHSHIPFYGIRTTVTFAIQKCSWTHRPYTIYTGNDLVQMAYEPVNARLPLRTKFDRTLEMDFEAGSSAECVLDCCAVRGVA